MMHKPLISSDLIVIDGDRGKNYPKQEDFLTSGHCIFLNTTNVTKNGFDFSECIFISEEKNNTLGKGIVKANDIVLTTRGTVGNSGFYSEIISKNFPACRINSGMVILRCNSEKLNPYFVYIFIKSDLFLSQVDALRSGSAQPQLPIRDIKQITIPDLTLQKQHGIASILGSIDDKIDLNHRTNETLEAMARTLFRDWFVDFGPTRAKMAGQTPYLAPEVWELFPDRLDDEGKPEGWRNTVLETLVTVNPPERLQKNADAPYLSMSELPVVGCLASEPVRRPFSSGSKFRNGDTLFARITPCLENGKTALVHHLEEGEVGWGSTEFLVLRGKNHVPFPWVYLLARDDLFRTYAIQGMSGTSGRQRVPSEILEKYEIVVPEGNALWKAFERQTLPMFEKIFESGAQGADLAQLRDLLLPKLMSGEIRIRDAEKTVADAL